MRRPLPTVDSHAVVPVRDRRSPCWPARLALTVLLACALLVAADSARADEAVVVLDRGKAAEPDAETHARSALRLVEALRARDVTANLVLYGTRPDGRIRASQLGDDLEEALARAARREGYQFEAPTDPRHALEIALRKVADPGPLLVFLVGPFDRAAGRADDEGPSEDAGGDDPEDRDPKDAGTEEDDSENDDPDGAAGPGSPEDEDPESASARKALATWEEKAPRDVRVFAFDLARERRVLLDGVRGVLPSGAVVLAAQPSLETIEPYSPVGMSTSNTYPDLRAGILVELDSLVIGSNLDRSLLLARSSDGLGKVMPGWSRDGSRAGISVTRPGGARLDAPKVETLAFEVPDDPSILWLVDPPQPRTIQWTELEPDARITTITWFEDGHGELDGGANPFDARGVLVGKPIRQKYLLEFSRVGDVPDWQVVPANEESGDGEVPEGMTIAIGDVVNRTRDVASVDIVITFAARRGLPLEAEGTLVARASGHPKQFEIPYHVETPVGRIVARLDAPNEAYRLPASEDAPPWTLVLEEKNPNAPALVRVEAMLDPPSLAAQLTARLVGGGGVDVAWDLAQRIEIRPGRRYELRLGLAPGVRSAEGTFALRLPEQRGVEGSAQGRGSVAGRSPRLVIAKGNATYAMDGGEVVGDPPLMLEVDPDGGTGGWRLALHEATPTVETEPGAPALFTVRAEGPGRWALVPEGAWEGARGDTFSGRTETVPVTVAWSMGSAPGTVDVQIEVRPRWGKAGWILAGLAVLALALGLWGVTQLKAAPVEGTLLYTMEGRQAAVGRLDLAPVGRRVTLVTADEAGRLGLGGHRPGVHGAGTGRPGARGASGRGETVVVIRPTRVGGILEIPPPGGPERHLLVDGLTVTAGRHRIRYVSGRPGDATVSTVSGPGEELLGPEFDMPTGRIDALGRDPELEAETEADAP